MSGRNHGRVRQRREETRWAILPPRSVPSQPPLRALSLKARGRFSEATGADGIRVELDYTAKGYIYRARMYAEARTSPQRGRPCGFSLDATSRVDSRFSYSSHPTCSRSKRRIMDCLTFLLAASSSLPPSLPPFFLSSFLPSFHFPSFQCIIPNFPPTMAVLHSFATQLIASPRFASYFILCSKGD